MARETDLRATIASLLEGEPRGLEVPGIIDRLGDATGSVSSRTVRNILNDMTDAGELVRQRRATSVRGAPRLVYYHPRHVATQLMLTDLVPGLESIEIRTRGQIERQDLDPEERDRQSRSTSLLERLAKIHVDEEHLAHAIVLAARQLENEDPVQLILDMAQWVVDDLNSLGSTMRRLAASDLGRAEDVAGELEVRLQWARRVLWGLFRLDRPIAETAGILELPARPRDFLGGDMAKLDPYEGKKRLSSRVIGNRFLEVIDLDDCAHSAVAGTDGSIADIYLEHSRGSFVPPDPVAVMTAAAAMQVRRQDDQFEYQEFDIYPDQLREYGESQAAINGLILSPIFRNWLPEGYYEHSRLAAMDLRQYMEDLRIILKETRWRPMGEAPLLDNMPRPTMIVRDGRIFPMVHRLEDYEDDGLYGKIVRREIERFTRTLFNLADGPTGRTVYAGTVKNPELSWLSPLVMWYLLRRRVAVGGKHITPDQVYRPPLADTAVAHLLFLGLAKERKQALEGRAFRTFRLVRRFSDIAIGKDGSLPVIPSQNRVVDEADREDWLAFIKDRQEERRREYRFGRDSSAALSLDEYEPFVYACWRAATVIAYMAPSNVYRPLVIDEHGAHFLLPRLEFGIDASQYQSDDARRRLDRDVRSLLAWMAFNNGMIMDSAHSQTAFGSIQTGGLPILVPTVIVAAHEAATFARRMLGDELTDSLKALVSELRRRQSQKSGG